MTPAQKEAYELVKQTYDHAIEIGLWDVLLSTETVRQLLGNLVASQPAPAADTGQAVEPKAFVVVDPVGGERIVDASKHDPRKAAFWLNPEVQARYKVIPLGPVTYPAPLDAERVREDERDRLMSEAVFPHEFGPGAVNEEVWTWLGKYAGAMKPALRAALRQKEGKA